MRKILFLLGAALVIYIFVVYILPGLVIWAIKLIITLAVIAIFIVLINKDLRDGVWSLISGDKPPTGDN